MPAGLAAVVSEEGALGVMGSLEWMGMGGIGGMVVTMDVKEITGKIELWRARLFLKLR